MQSVIMVAAALLALISAVRAGPDRPNCVPSSPDHISRHLFDQLLDFTNTRLRGDLSAHFSTFDNFRGNPMLVDYKGMCGPNTNNRECTNMAGPNLRLSDHHRHALCPWTYDVIVDRDSAPEVTVEARLTSSAKCVGLGANYECRPVKRYTQVMDVSRPEGSNGLPSRRGFKPPCQYKLRFRPITIGYTCSRK